MDEQPIVNDPFPVHENSRRRGWSGLGHTDKTPFQTGENAALPNALFNDADTLHRLQREQPSHRRMLEYTIQGFTKREVARLCGVSAPTVKNVLRQPWARQYMIDRLQKDAVSEIQDLLKQELKESIGVVIEVRDSPLTRPETRLNAANSVIDRVLGRAAQPIVTTNIDLDKASDNELDTIIANERKRLASLVANDATNAPLSPSPSSGEEGTASSN